MHTFWCAARWTRWSFIRPVFKFSLQAFTAVYHSLCKNSLNRINFNFKHLFRSSQLLHSLRCIANLPWYLRCLCSLQASLALQSAVSLEVPSPQEYRKFLASCSGNTGQSPGRSSEKTRNSSQSMSRLMIGGTTALIRTTAAVIGVMFSRGIPLHWHFVCGPEVFCATSFLSGVRYSW